MSTCNDSSGTSCNQRWATAARAVSAAGTAVPTAKATSTGMQENVAALLSYVFGFITGIIFVVIEKENRFVRFHAFQSIFVSVALMILSYVVWFIPVIGWVAGALLWPVSLLLWLLLMFKAYKGELYKLPFVGDIAEKQAGLT